MIKKFKVKAGMHTEGGKIYKKNEIVVSEKDLVKLFPNKFDLVGVVEEPDKEDDGDDGGEKEVVNDPPTKPEAKKKKSAKKKADGDKGDDWDDD